MKLSGIFGKGSGKVGSSVFAVSGGEQIVREYNPKVSNPQTDAQVQQRAKLKLLSQIAAALAAVIAFAKKGLVSARNQFISANYPSVDWQESKATILLEDIDLTGGNSPLPNVVPSANGNVALEAAAAAEVDHVLYVGVKANEYDQLEIVGKTLVMVPGAGRTFPGTIQGLESGNIVYAYGISYANTSDKVRFENYFANMTDEQATLDIVKASPLSGATFTKTKAAKLS